MICDIVTRTVGYPWLWLQEATMTFFIYGIFIGVAAATRRNDHLYLAVLAEVDDRQSQALLRDIQSPGRARGRRLHDLFRLPERSRRLQEPAHAVDDAAVDPLCGDPAGGILVALFTVEQIVNGWKNGFEGTGDADERRKSL